MDNKEVANKLALYWQEAPENMKNVIANACLILREQKQGKWCRKMYDAWECSYCHKVEYTQDIASYHYCRHCGAKMGEVTHDTKR